VALADGGTLFLDEVGELPLLLQAKLLHFLEDGSYRPVGSNRSRTANARVIAATNRPLETEVREGRFREDLFFRLNVIELLIPPLRERGNDISLMLEQFAEIQAREERCQVIHYALETLETLRHYAWPGNVRELKNLVERLTILYPGQLIKPSHLPIEMQREDLHPDYLGERMKKTERQIVMEALAQTVGHKGKAAEFLGLSRHAFKRRLQRLGLE
jgi:DNA-binding NtrC family response regulator